MDSEILSDKWIFPLPSSFPVLSERKDGRRATSMMLWLSGPLNPAWWMAPDYWWEFPSEKPVLVYRHFAEERARTKPLRPARAGRWRHWRRCAWEEHRDRERLRLEMEAGAWSWSPPEDTVGRSGLHSKYSGKSQAAHILLKSTAERTTCLWAEVTKMSYQDGGRRHI